MDNRKSCASHNWKSCASLQRSWGRKAADDVNTFLRPTLRNWECYYYYYYHYYRYCCCCCCCRWWYLLLGLLALRPSIQDYYKVRQLICKFYYVNFFLLQSATEHTYAWDLDWLPVEERIVFKINLITFKTLNGSGPRYLEDILKFYHQSRTLRSSRDHLRLEEPNFNMKTYGQRAFSVAAPRLWNKFPFEIRACSDVNLFKSKLKMFLFKKVYDN